MDASCATCRFARAEVHEGRWPADPEPALTCHRYPATVFVVDGEPVRAFPDTNPDDWCGEYQEATDAAASD